MRPDPSPSGIPCWPLLAAVVLLVGCAVASFGPRQSAPCPACVGHRESASECLCYHAPTAPDSPPRRPEGAGPGRPRRVTGSAPRA